MSLYSNRVTKFLSVKCRCPRSVLPIIIVERRQTMSRNIVIRHLVSLQLLIAETMD